MESGGAVNRLFCFGFGYSAEVLARRLKNHGWRVGGTVRSPDRQAELERWGFEAAIFDGHETSEARTLLKGTTHLLHSIPPGEDGDAALNAFRDDLLGHRGLRWIGYLSTIGVYGNHDGAWIDETSETDATSVRGRRRIDAEQAWRALGRKTGVPTHIFRLAGIYGPGRNPIVNVRSGRAHRIVKPGQVFNRIHVEDIATVLQASIARPRAGAVYNVADDEPAPPQDVVAHAAALLGVPPPPVTPFEQAELSPMARSFYADNKRVRNGLIKRELGVTLAFPDYRSGLASLVTID